MTSYTRKLQVKLKNDLHSRRGYTRMTQVDLSIIIASYNTLGLLKSCIQSITETTSGIDYEVIVVDDCSTDGSPEMVQNQFPAVRLIINPENMRYAKTNNAGLKAACGRYSLLLNSDTVIQPGAFKTLVDFMDDHPEAAAAGPKLINPDGSVQHCIRSFPSVLPMVFQTLNLHKIWPGNPITEKYYNTKFEYDKPKTVQSLGTTSFIIRRDTLEKYGMLDERFTLAFVDLAYCHMLWRNKAPIYIVPDAVVMHYGSQSINQLGENEIIRGHKALREFYEICFASGHNKGTQFLIRRAITIRQLMKILEYRLSKDKRIITGPGAPSVSRK